MHINNEPYSLYVNKRPLRIAFLVNPANNIIKQVQCVINYSMNKWGGRYYPIIFSDGKDIDEPWWNLLCNIDPDMIISFTPLKEELIKKIDMFLTPKYLQAPEEIIDDFSKCPICNQYTQYDGITIAPTLKNINSVCSSKLIIPNLDAEICEEIKQFVNLNFCTYPTNDANIINLKQDNKIVIDITDYESLKLMFTSLVNSNYVAYPIQICSIPHNFKRPKLSGVENPFIVIVGDSPEDIVYNWNIIFSYSNWQRKLLNNIRLPSEIVKNSLLTEPLRQWFKTMCYDIRRNNHRIRFISFSLNKDELKDIANQFSKGLLSKECIPYHEIQIPTFEENPNLLSIKSDMDFYQASGNNTKIDLITPDLDSGKIIQENWVADIYMQYYKNQYPNIQGLDLWWRLPAINNLSRLLFDNSSRICTNGIPSVFFTLHQPKLNIHLPDTRKIFETIIENRRKPDYKSDVRNKLKPGKLFFATPSDTGKYLGGIISLFGDVYSCKMYFEIKFWRNVFSILSNFNTHKNDNMKKIVMNKLNKKNKAFLDSDKGRDWLADLILKTSIDIFHINEEIDNNRFKDEAKNECKKFNNIEDNRQLDDNEESFIRDMNDSLAELIDLEVILIGIKPQCPYCGISQWYSIDELKQKLVCKGCRKKFSIRSEEPWYYKLNSLISFGYHYQGLAPVILVLGQLLEESKSSFIFDVCLNIYDKFIDKEPFTDLDIVCIQDGKFIIGEMKQSCKGFEEKDFNKIKEIAVNIHPDIILFSALENQCSTSLERKIDKLRDELLEYKIEIKWYQLRSHVFESSLII